MFSFPLNTTSGKNLRIGAALLGPNRKAIVYLGCVFGAEEALLWGQSVAPVGLTSLWGRDVCPVQRSEGCNQTAGRLPRRLGSAGVDVGVCVSHPCI